LEEIFNQVLRPSPGIKLEQNPMNEQASAELTEMDSENGR
jgi:hypothetical protein